MYYFIINPNSRSGMGLKVWKKTEVELKKQKIVYKKYFTHYEFHAKKIAAKICNEYSGIKTIVILGGDGTVNEVINGITDYSDVILGYIPSGSSNDLARSLNISKDPVIALNRILHRNRIRYLDLGQLKLLESNKSKRFIVSMGMGFDAAICYEALNSRIKDTLNRLGMGKLTYVIIALKRLIKHKPISLRTIIDGRYSRDFKDVFFIAALNQKFEGGGLLMAPNAKNNDHKLNLCIIYDIPKWKALFLLPSLFFGWQNLFHGVTMLECSSIEVKSMEPVVVHTDGEYCGKITHLYAHCSEQQIRIIT